MSRNTTGRTLRKPGSILSLATKYAPKKPWAAEEEGEYQTEEQIRALAREIKTNEKLMPTPIELVNDILSGKTTLDEIQMRPDVDKVTYNIVRLEYIKRTRAQRKAQIADEESAEHEFDEEKLQDSIVKVPKRRGRKPGVKYPKKKTDSAPSNPAEPIKALGNSGAGFSGTVAELIQALEKVRDLLSRP